MGDLELRLKYKKEESDDWTKVEDRALRKKIQNRLAKRKNRDDARRSKRKSEPTSNSTTDEAGENTAKLTAISLVADLSQVAVSSDYVPVTASGNLNLRDQMGNYVALPGLAEHRHIHLPHYSLYRAMTRNAEVLGFDPFLIHDDDALSPWTASDSLSIPGRHNLHPTPTQLCTPHHPYLDVIAIPSLRDNIIVATLSESQEDEICYDIHQNSISVWGSQPWNAMSWEVTQSFVDKWWWLLGDEVVSQADFWRAERGEEPLKVPVVDIGSIVEEIP